MKTRVKRKSEGAGGRTSLWARGVVRRNVVAQTTSVRYIVGGLQASDCIDKQKPRYGEPRMWDG